MHICQSELRRRSIAHGNRAMPRTARRDACVARRVEIDLAAEVHVHPYGREPSRRRRGGATHRGTFVADLVAIGATLQLGIGTIPRRDGPRARGQARPRRPHGDGLRQRRGPGRGRGHHRGAQGAQPREDRGRVRAGLAAPLRRSSVTIRWRAARPSTSPATHHVIRSFHHDDRHDSAIEVDLTGQVVADSIGRAVLQRRRRPDGLRSRRRAGGRATPPSGSHDGRRCGRLARPIRGGRAGQGSGRAPSEHAADHATRVGRRRTSPGSRPWPRRPLDTTIADRDRDAGFLTRQARCAVRRERVAWPTAIRRGTLVPRSAARTTPMASA